MDGMEFVFSVMESLTLEGEEIVHPIRFHGRLREKQNENRERVKVYGKSIEN